MADDVTFGRWLQQRRKGLALTQDQLGKCVGCAGATVRKFEAEERRPSVDIAARLFTCLQLPSEEQTAFLRFARGESAQSPAIPGVATPSLPWQTEAVSSTLPLTSTPFIGRSREVTAVGSLLQRSSVRLVTLTGTGGTGKSRLALQVASDLAEIFPDGVYFVALAPVTEVSLIMLVISQALGIKEATSQPLVETLTGYLRAKHLLMVLDNMEQLLPAGALIVAEVLKRAPELTILVTSRMPLHLSAEHEYPVPTLTLPKREPLPALGVLAQNEAVALFIERAQAVKPDFAITDANAAAVTEICYRLDGLPLAIELAAAHSKVLPSQALLARLNNRLVLLRGGAHDRPARQQTLRSTIDWSYALLAPREQMLFRRLGVFVGGWSLEAAEHVCEIEGEDGVLDGIAVLVDQSLLRQEEGVDGAASFSMLETLREYALEQLEASREEPALRSAHAAYYLSLAERAQPKLGGPEQDVWLARLALEHDNLRAALAWTLREESTPADAVLGGKLANALGWFWLTHPHFEEGRRWLDAALRRHPAATELRELLLYHAGALAREQYDYDRARALVEESLAMSRERGDQSQVGSALLALGRHTMAPGDVDRAIVRLEESLALFEALGVTRGRAWALASLGEINRVRTELAHAIEQLTESRQLFEAVGDAYGIAYACTQLGQVVQQVGDYERAMVLFKEGLAGFRALRNRRGAGFAQMLLGWTALDQGQIAEAQERLEESLATFRSIKEEGGTAWALVHFGQLALQQGNHAWAQALLSEGLALFRVVHQPQGIAWALAYQGQLAGEQGQLGRAHILLSESLGLFKTVGARAGVAMVLERMAVVALQQDAATHATRLCSSAERLRELVGAPRPFALAVEYERTVARLREKLGALGFGAAWTAGRALSLEQTIGEALEPMLTLELRHGGL